MVSGTISLFCSKCFSPFNFWYWFTIGLSGFFSLTHPDGPGWFPQNSSCPLLRIPLGVKLTSYTGLSPSMVELFQMSTHRFSCHNVVLQPICRNDTHGLGFPVRSPLLGNHYLFFLHRVLRCFSVPYVHSNKVGLVFKNPGCPIQIRGSGHFAPTRSLSQLITSFIASECQGIPMRPYFWSF